MGTTGKQGGGKAKSPAPKRNPTSKAKSAPNSKVRASAKVYRRRRLVALVLVLLFVAGIAFSGVYVAGLFGMGPAAKTETQQDGNGAAAKPKAADNAGTKPSAVCDEAGIQVTAATDKPSYAVDENPVLSLRVTNTGAAPCDINVGTSQMEYVITSGDDIIYNSKNCQLDPNDLVKNLAPGASETANFVWKVKRNAPDCAPVVSEPGRGGATYVLVATLGKWSSERVPFTLQ